MAKVKLREIAYARSGDKGSQANIGVIAYSKTLYDHLQELLTAELVEHYFLPMGASGVQRYELPNLWALNFVLPDILAGGGSRSLHIDAQGKTLGQAILELEIELPEGMS